MTTAAHPVSYYADPGTARALTVVASAWLGTPFRYGSCVMGPRGGVDCVALTWALHHKTGAAEIPHEFDRLPLHWHEHHDSSAILEFMREARKTGRLHVVVAPGDPAPDPAVLRHGDLVAIKTGLAAHHLGTWLDDTMGRHLLHVPINGTVQRWPLFQPPLAGRVAGVWRITCGPTPAAAATARPPGPHV